MILTNLPYTMVSVVNDYLSGVDGEGMLSVICMVMDTID